MQGEQGIFGGAVHFPEGPWSPATASIEISASHGGALLVNSRGLGEEPDVLILSNGRMAGVAAFQVPGLTSSALIS